MTIKFGNIPEYFLYHLFKFTFIAFNNKLRTANVKWLLRTPYVLEHSTAFPGYIHLIFTRH